MIRVGAAQLGPTLESDSREHTVARMVALFDEAVSLRCDLVVFPELALTPYFPKVVRDDYDQFFETSMPGPATQPLFDRARATGTSFYLGYAEKTPEGRYFNTAIYVDGTGEVVQRYRKLHLPGMPKDQGKALVYEPHYFERGDEGYAAFDTSLGRMGMALCQDRRYPETYRTLALQGADLVLLGYNTPVLPLSAMHNDLAMQSGAYANGVFVVGVAKAGVEDGVRLLARSCIIDPHGQVLARASSEGDELITARVDLAQLDESRGHWNFMWRRRPEHYGALTEPIRDGSFVARPRPL